MHILDTHYPSLGSPTLLNSVQRISSNTASTHFPMEASRKTLQASLRTLWASYHEAKMARFHLSVSRELFMALRMRSSSFLSRACGTVKKVFKHKKMKCQPYSRSLAIRRKEMKSRTQISHHYCPTKVAYNRSANGPPKREKHAAQLYSFSEI